MIEDPNSAETKRHFVNVTEEYEKDGERIGVMAFALVAIKGLAKEKDCDPKDISEIAHAALLKVDEITNRKGPK